MEYNFVCPFLRPAYWNTHAVQSNLEQQDFYWVACGKIIPCCLADFVDTCIMYSGSKVGSLSCIGMLIYIYSNTCRKQSTKDFII